MDKLNDLISCIELPKVAKVLQKFPSEKVEDISATLLRQLLQANIIIKPNTRIAITAGSRGIASYSELLKTIVQFVKRKDAIPIIIPSMGSHGGATASGQREILKEYGITEKSMGAKILSSMEVNKIGTTDLGLPVYVDKNACSCDGIILFNRIKPHTTFRGPYESGLLKMLAIGLAKQEGADATHSLRFENMAENIVKVGKLALAKLNIVCAVGSIENAYHEVSEIAVLKSNEVLEKEPALLDLARRKMARICLDTIDGLIVGSMGKEISGTGMDTNITGRVPIDGVINDPEVVQLGVLDLTKKSGGNATGVGYADFISRKLFDKIDFEKTYINTITSTARGSTKIPPVMDTDKLVIQAVTKTCGQTKMEDKKIVLVNNTSELSEIYMTRAAIEAISYPDLIRSIGDFQDIKFDKNKNLKMF